MADERSRTASPWRSAVGVALSIGLAASIARFLAFVTLAALNHDEAEFCHDAWLIARGARPFVDFFEHHNPLYLYLLSALVGEPGQSLEFVVRARFLSFALALVSAALAASIVFLAAREAPRRAKVETALFAALATLELQAGARAFEIRPDCLAVPACLAAWLLSLVAVDAARAGPRRAASLLAGLFLGLAVGATIRAAVLATALFALTAIPLARRGERGAVALLTAGAGAAFAACTLPRPRLFLDWVVRFSGSRPRIPISAYALVPAPANFALGAIVVAALIVVVVRVARGAIRSGSPDLAAWTWPLLAACAGLVIETQAHRTSLIFVSLAAAIWASLALQRLPARVFAAVLAFAGIASGLAMLVDGVAWRRLASIEVLADLRPVPSARAWDDGLGTSLRERGALRDRLRDERVLAGPDVHPIVVEDVSYWWYGNTMIAAGTLEASGVEHRPYTFVGDVLDGRPALIGGPDILVPLREMARREGRLERLDELLRTEYVERGFVRIRKDLVARFDR
jgi:hypothetical protein